jgi:phage tail sheath gpL-like
MPSQVATYQLDDSTTVSFEIEPTEGFRPAGPGQIAGKVREAVAPAVEAAKEVLDRVKELAPDEVEVKFGIKVSGGAQWLVAKATGEASFEVTLTWSPRNETQHSQAAIPATETQTPKGRESAEPASQ